MRQSYDSFANNALECPRPSRATQSCRYQLSESNRSTSITCFNNQTRWKQVVFILKYSNAPKREGCFAGLANTLCDSKSTNFSQIFWGQWVVSKGTQPTSIGMFLEGPHECQRLLIPPSASTMHQNIHTPSRHTLSSYVNGTIVLCQHTSFGLNKTSLVQGSAISLAVSVWLWSATSIVYSRCQKGITCYPNQLDADGQQGNQHSLPPIDRLNLPYVNQ